MPPAATPTTPIAASNAASGGRWKHLILVARADPIVCGHATETRHLAEAAIKDGGFTSVHIVTYPMAALEASGLPLKDSVQMYSPGIHVHRPEPVGDCKVLDGRMLHALSGRVVELLLRFGDEPTIVMQLYLVPHGRVVMDAVNAVRTMPGRPAGRGRILTVAKACGSDITSQLATALAQGNLGAVHVTLGNYLAHDLPLAVSEFTKTAILEAASKVDAAAGTEYATELARRVKVSYPPVLEPWIHDAKELTQGRDALARYGLVAFSYVLFLSRCTEAKGVRDLVDGYIWSETCRSKGVPLVLCTTGPDLKGLHAMLKARVPGPLRKSVRVLSNVTDDDKIWLYRNCIAFVLPSKPTPDFTETLGIVLVEKALAEGVGPTLATRTGGIPEATGGHCFEIEAGNPASIRTQLDRVSRMDLCEKRSMAREVKAYVARFERVRVFRHLLGLVDSVVEGA